MTGAPSRTEAERLAQALSGIGRPRVLVVGDLMLDHYVFGRVERISPEAPIPILRVEREDWRPGGAGSVVAMLERLGAEVELIGVTGRDAPGERLRRELGGLGVGLEHVLLHPDRPTTLKTRHIAGAQHVLRVDHEVAAPYEEALDREVQARIADRLPRCDAVLVSDYGKGLLRGGALARLAALGRAHGKEVILDPKKSPDYSAYRGVTAITPNRAETEAGTGIAPNDPARREAAAAKLARDLDLDKVVITLDREGIYLHDGRGGEHVHVPTEAQAVFDVTGAGDMVLAMVGLSRAAGLGWPDAVRLANAAAGVEIQRLGVAPLTRAEVAAALLTGHSVAAQKVTTLETFVQGPLRDLRRRGARVVYTNGCYDLLHAGHIHLLQFARAQGDHLVVGLNDDASVTRLKGAGRPILAARDRAAILAALEAVGHVLVFPEDTPLAHIEAIRPDVLVKASDYEGAGKTVVGRSIVEGYGGKVAFGPLVGGVSTTEILARVKGAPAADDPSGRAARAAAEAAYAAIEADAAERARAGG